MIKLHFRIKARAFGITFGTIEDTKDVTAVLFTILAAVVPAPFKSQVGTLGLAALPSPIKLYDDRGVFIELK